MSDWTTAQLAALDAEEARKQQMRAAGVDPANPAEREAWEAGYDASSGDVLRIVDDWYARYQGFSRVDEDVYLALRNRLVPLAPGQPVQFRELGHTRWLKGTLAGPVDSPDDPLRDGDVYVTAASGRRVAVFLSSVRPV